MGRSRSKISLTAIRIQPFVWKEAEGEVFPRAGLYGDRSFNLAPIAPPPHRLCHTNSDSHESRYSTLHLTRNWAKTYMTRIYRCYLNLVYAKIVVIYSQINELFLLSYNITIYMIKTLLLTFTLLRSTFTV